MQTQVWNKAGSESDQESQEHGIQNKIHAQPSFRCPNSLAGVARKPKEFKKTEVVYPQGDAANSVMFLQKGGVKLSVVNGVGKEAVVAILGPGDFFGEGCLAGQAVRMGMATAITASTIHVIEKSEMLRVLHEQHAQLQQSDWILQSLAAAAKLSLTTIICFWAT